MTLKKFELKALTREEWRALDKKKLREQLEKLSKECPLVLHTEAGRTFLMVRRMKAEKRWVSGERSQSSRCGERAIGDRPKRRKISPPPRYYRMSSLDEFAMTATQQFE